MSTKKTLITASFSLLAVAAVADASAGDYDGLMLPGGVVLSDRPLQRPNWTPLPLPQDERWTYHAWKVDG